MIKTKKLTALVLAGTIMTTAWPSSPALAQTFSDVPSNHWAYKVIDEVSNDGIMAGLGNNIFAPDKTLSRAEFAALLYKMTPNKSSSNDSEHVDGILLNDVDSGAWYYEAVSWAAEHGYLSVNDGYVEPEEIVTREDMGSAIYRFLDNFYSEQLVYNEVHEPFADEDQFSSEAAIGKVYILVNNKVLGGKGNNVFDPQGGLTRAETASVISRMDKVINKKPSSLNDGLQEKAKELLEAGDPEITDTEQEFIDILNEERASVGAHALQPSELLMEAAKVRAKEVVAKGSVLSRDEFYDEKAYPNSYWHDRLDGSNASTAVMDLLDEGSATYAIYCNMHPQENLVRRYGDTVMTPMKAHVSLMGSPGHKKNMLNDNHDYIGVAYYNDGTCSAWVQVFGGV